MLNKILFAIILGTFAGLAPADAQTTPAAPAKIRGRIIAAHVEGHVEAITKATGAIRVLHEGDMISDGVQVVTAPGAEVVLSFSNGADVNVAGDSTLDIDEFIQDPFSADIKVSELKEEPGTSTTKLNLAKGELVGKVVHLNVDKGSEFTVQTPVGAAGIRGTTFRMIFRPGPNGTALFSIVTADGRVVFRGVTTAPVDIPAGTKVVVTFTVSSGVASTPVIVSPVTPEEATQVAAAAQVIATATATTTFTGSGGGGGGGGGGTSGTPSGSTNQQSSTTSQAGSG